MANPGLAGFAQAIVLKAVPPDGTGALNSLPVSQLRNAASQQAEFNGNSPGSFNGVPPTGNRFRLKRQIAMDGRSASSRLAGALVSVLGRVNQRVVVVARTVDFAQYVG